MKTIIPVLKFWIPTAAIISAVCLLIYVTVQQTYRSNANDPQIQMAEDAAFALKNGAKPQTLVSAKMTEISQSLNPYLILFDETGKSIASDGVLDGKIPTMPDGVLDYTKQNAEDRITWQPRKEVRSALEILHVQGAFNGFVVAGRSLRIVEERESSLIKQLITGWIFSIVLLFIVIVAVEIASNNLRMKKNYLIE
ncbi:MAG: hypothetical protein H0W62_03130 [Chitinophagales bacterium]|nr:hypothetical protein [Chitinophagales bacterium]